MRKSFQKYSALTAVFVAVLMVAFAISVQTSNAQEYSNTKNVALTPTTHWSIDLYLQDNNPNTVYATVPGVEIIRLYQRDTTSTWPHIEVAPTFSPPIGDTQLFNMPVGAYNPANNNHYTYYFDPNGNTLGFGAALMVKSCAAGTGDGCFETIKIECAAVGVECSPHEPYDIDFNANGDGIALYGVPGRVGVEDPISEEQRLGIVIYRAADDSWTNVTLPSGIGARGEFKPEHQVPTLAFDNDGRPHIAYANPGRDGKLHHAWYDGNIKDAYDESKWKTSEVADIGTVGSFDRAAIGLAINPVTNSPVISYYHSDTKDVHHAYMSGGTWNNVLIDDSSSDLGFTNSIGVDHSGIISISYVDTTNEKLRYAYFKNGKWTTTDLDTEGELTGHGSKLKVGTNNHVYMLYSRRKPGTTPADGEYEWLSAEVTHPESADKSGGDQNLSALLASKGISSTGTGRHKCGRDKVSQQKLEEKAFSLRKELEGVSKDKQMHRLGIDGNNWGTYVDLYVYCDYPIDALILRHFFGPVVDDNTNWYVHRNSEAYNKNIFQTIPGYQDKINGDAPRYYAKLRVSLAKEKELAEQVRKDLEAKYDLKSAQINAHNWAKIVNAVIYGGYNTDEVARAIVFGGKVVHPWWPQYQWRSSQDYKDYVSRPI